MKKKFALQENIPATPTPAQMLWFLTTPLLSVSQGIGVGHGSLAWPQTGPPSPSGPL